MNGGEPNPNYQKGMCIKFNGENWVPVGTSSFSTGPVRGNKIAISPNGTANVLFYDDNASNKLTAMWYGTPESPSPTPTPTPTPAPHAPTPAPTPPPAIIIINGVDESIGTSGTRTENGVTTTTVTGDPRKVREALDAGGKGSTVVIPILHGPDVAIGELGGDLVQQMEDLDAVLEIRTDNASYFLPAHDLDIGGIAEQLGAVGNLSGIQIRVEIAEPDPSMLKVVENISSGGFTLVMPAVDFKVTCSYGGKTIEVSRFNSYVERDIAIPDGVDPSKITTGIVLEPDGTFRHVPTTVAVINGKYYARIMNLTNSTYSVIWHPISFADMAGHWAMADAEDMASRMVIDGVNATDFNPSGTISRGEFAEVLVKALGLKPGMGANPFTDVAADNPQLPYILTASYYGLISGYGSGTFGPTDNITRAQAAVMLENAMKLTGLFRNVGPYETQSLLAPYTDGQLAPDWADNAMANCVRVGIIAGTGTETLSPGADLSRAEAAAMVRRLLQKSGLI